MASGGMATATKSEGYKYDSYDHQKIGRSSHEFGNGSYADDGINVSIDAIGNGSYNIGRPGYGIRRD